MDAADKEWCVDRVNEAAEIMERVRRLIERSALEEDDNLVVALGRLSQATYAANHAAKAVSAL